MLGVLPFRLIPIRLIHYVGVRNRVRVRDRDRVRVRVRIFSPI